MKFLESLMRALNKLPAAIGSSEMILIITAGIALLVFLILTVLIIANKPKFIKTASKVNKYLKKGDSSQLNNYMKDLPKTQLNAWKQYLKTRKGRPSACFNTDACLNTPYHASVAVTGPIVMAITTILTTLIAGVFAIIVPDLVVGLIALIDNIAVLCVILVAFAGVLLTLILYLIARGSYKKCAKIYDEFCSAIDGVMSGNNASSAHEESNSSNEYIAAEPVHNMQETPIVMQTEDEPVVVVANNDYDNNRQQSYSMNEIRIEEVKDEEKANAEEEERAREAKAAEAAAKEREAAAKERAERIEAARAAQAAAQAQAQAQAVAQAQAQAAKPQAQPVTPAQPAQAAAPKAQPAAPKNEDIVDRIDRMIKEGATQQQMREVAILLQQERQKPENKSPEQTRRLNDALSRLLKAMATAPKA